MQYVLTFMEGFISFISPCMLPMLPIYVSYFAGADHEKRKVLPRAISFVLGFSVVFCILGVLAGTVGAFLQDHKTVVNIVSGGLMVLFGLSYLEILPLNFLKGMKRKFGAAGIVSAFLFGMVFAVNLTPCVGAFLGSALMLAASIGGARKGLLLLVVYSLGLGVPLVISAVLIEKMKNVFTWIKKHYKIINTVCGLFLIAIGIMTACGLLGTVLAIL